MLILGIVWLPDAAFVPDQSPLAIHVVGLLLTLQVMVVLPPGAIGPDGLASIVTRGTSGGSSCTVT